MSTTNNNEYEEPLKSNSILPSDETDTQDNHQNQMSTSSLFSISSNDDGSTEFQDSSAISTSATMDNNNNNKYVYTGDPPLLKELNRRYRHIVVDKTLEKLPPKCFAKCFSLQSVEMHMSLKEMGEQAFFYCRNLVELDLPASLSHLPYQALSGCGRLKLVSFKEGLQAIGMQAFQQCSSLTEIELPSTLNSLGNAAFKGCYDLQHVQFHDLCKLKVIQAHTFCMCYSMEEIELPSTVEELGDECFSNCVCLKQVTRKLSSSTTTTTTSDSMTITPMRVIGHGCFLQCMGLVELLNFGNLQAVEHMGEMAFEGCGQLKKEVVAPPTTQMSEHSRASIRNSLSVNAMETAASIKSVQHRASSLQPSQQSPTTAAAVAEEEGEEEI